MADMAEIADKDLRKIQKMLNKTISSLLYGGSSDPGFAECEGAAACFKTLKLLGLKVTDEKDITEQLSDPTQNVSEHNFLE
jgi:hypothetical protein